MNPILHRVWRKVNHLLSEIDHAAVRSLVSKQSTRGWLNACYRSYSWPKKERFYRKYAKLFRGRDQAIEPGDWSIPFAGKSIVLPLSGDQIWLEWDQALSACGHEVDIKMTYETLIQVRRPAVFFDIGANYGLHSLLFLAHGVPAVTFEPNPACHDYFRRICALNGVASDLQPLALDAEEGSAELWFPETETWFGTINPAMKERIAQGETVASVRIRKTTLDQFVRQSGRRPELIKIDTEGNEERVLRGGAETLRTCRPIIIFESWPDGNRDGLPGLLVEAGYRITALPSRPRTVPTILDSDAFRASQDSDFLALPSEEFDGGRVPWLG